MEEKQIMFEVITTITTNLFRTFITHKFLNTFFSEKKEKKGLWAAYGLFFLVMMGMNFIFMSPWVNILCNLLMLYLLTGFYEGEQKKKILVTIVIYGVNFICAVLSVFFLSAYPAGEAYSEIAPYVTVFFIGIGQCIIEKYIVKKRENNFTSLQGNILLLIPVISLVILNSMVVFNLNSRKIMTSISAGILMVNLLIFYLYNALIETYKQLQDNVLFERQIASYSHQLDVMMRSEEKISMLRHDMRHHMNELSAMAKQNKNAEIVDYLSQMQMFIKNKEDYLGSGNKDIDSLLNYLLSQAREVLQEVSYEINIPKDLKVRAFDLNVILGNLLENAIYAAKESEEKLLDVGINYNRGMLFIRVKNSYCGKIEKQGDKFLSTKTDGKDHGIGLQSVKRVVDTYNGTMEIIHDEKIFDVRLMIYV